MDALPNAKTKRVAVASFEFEGNDFSPKVCGREQFSPYGVGSDVWALIEGCPLAVTGGVEVLREAGNIELIPILIAHGGSGGRVDSDFYGRTVNLILEGLIQQGPFDGIYLALHGAMVTPRITDAEGDLLTRIRDALGDGVIIATSLDLHAHVTDTMVKKADIVVGYQNYPHDDAYETGKRAGALLSKTLRGDLNPVMRISRLNMVVPVPGSCTQGTESPLAKVKAFARSLENGAVVSTSYFTVQPWLDDDNAGNVALAICHEDKELTSLTANAIAEKLWSLRDEFELPLLKVEDAIALIPTANHSPVILADTGDSVGAGASGDSSFVLAALLRHAPETTCAVSLVDPASVKKAIAAGVGSITTYNIGFGLDDRYGNPLTVEARVESIHNGQFTYSAGPAAGVVGNMGNTVVLAIGGTRVLLASQGTYEYADEQFRAVGIDPDLFDVLVLKNGMNFRNLLQPNSLWILVDSVGSSSANLSELPWQNRQQPFWPRDREIRPHSR